MRLDPDGLTCAFAWLVKLCLHSLVSNWELGVWVVLTVSESAIGDADMSSLVTLTLCGKPYRVVWSCTDCV